LNALNNFKYGGKTVTSLTDTKAITAAKTVIPTSYTEISTSLAQNKKDAANYAKQLISPSSSSDVYKAPTAVSGETGNNPNLDEDIPTFYDFLKTNMGEDVEKIEDAIEENDSNNESNEDKADEEKASSTETSPNYITGVGSDTTLPSDSGETFGVSEVLGGLAGIVTTLTSGNYTEIRDRLYVVEYAMDMFSY
ncbi:MAG: hypothetical protein LUC83_03920, partial [Clostridiales bacterium]|nr:hypothetical protein [Clostridiales bacterium]